MIRIDGLRLELDFTQEDLRRAAAKKLRLPQWALAQVKLAKKSVDARKKEDRSEEHTSELQSPS